MGSHIENRAPTGVDQPAAGGDDESALEDPAGAAPSHPYLVHRLRDLSSRDRLIALALACALLVAPVSSAIRLFGVWTPTSDDALIEMRARDVGTRRTPLVGQPSTSGQYGKQDQNAAHPGPIEFYLLAPAERVLGGGIGMLLTTAALVGASVVVAAWAVFRQLGRGAGLAVSAALAATMWTSGARSMVDPLSSAVGRFPMLCSVVLLWCLLCGDVRLLAVATVALSFTVQQHLSIVPATLVVTAVGVLGLVVTLVRNGTLGDPTRRRELVRHVLLAAVVGLVLWSPVIYDQLTGSPGNITRIVRYAGDNSRDDVGYHAAFRQLGHALGLPPLLGRTNLSGALLLAPLSTFMLLTAVMVGALLALGALLWRRSRPRVSGLVVIAGALAVGGILNGANVPDSTEQGRIAFYHWAIILSFLELLILLLAVGPPAWGWLRTRAPQHRPMLAALGAPAVLLLVLAPAVGNLMVSRADNRLPYTIPKSTIDVIERALEAHRGELAGPTLLMSQGDDAYTGLYEAVAARLYADGFDIVHERRWTGYVADRRLVDYRTARSAILLTIGLGGDPVSPPGRKIVDADPAPDFDRDAFEQLIGQAGSASEVVIGAPLQSYLDRQLRRDLSGKDVTDGQKFLYRAASKNRLELLARLHKDPRNVLAQRDMLELLAAAPLASPKLSQRALDRVLDTFPTRQGLALKYTHVSVNLLDRQQLLELAPSP